MSRECWSGRRSRRNGHQRLLRNIFLKKSRVYLCRKINVPCVPQIVKTQRRPPKSRAVFRATPGVPKLQIAAALEAQDENASRDIKQIGTDYARATIGAPVTG